MIRSIFIYCFLQKISKIFFSFWLIIFILFLSCNVKGQVHAESAQTTEYYLKAGFIVNFARLIDWPPDDSKSKIVICVLDPVPFGNALKAISKKTIQGRKISIQICNTKTDFTEVDIVFLNSENLEFRKEIIKKINNKPVLTIGETPGFADNEGIINFYKLNNKLRFEINRGKAKQAGLKISSRLLKLGKLIAPKKKDS